MVMDKCRTNQKTIIHFYLPAQVNQVETWLSEQTKSGWELISMQKCKFVFIQCQPHYSKYFIYSGFDRSKGWSYYFHRAKQTFAKRKQPLINSSDHVFKADLSKVDVEFNKYLMSRNVFYRKHYIHLMIFSALFGICSGVLCCFEPRTLYLFLVWLMVFFYATVSVAIISRFI